MKPNIKIDKWDLNHVSSTQSVGNNWMTEYANLHLKNEINMDTTLVGTQSNESFPSLLPIAKKISAQTIGIDLVTVQPMDGLTNEERERIKREVATINRDRKLDSILEDKEYEEFTEKDHELFPKIKMQSSQLFYLDYAYTTPSTQSTSTNYTPPIKKRGKKKRTK